jgi:hypothetical protein
MTRISASDQILLLLRAKLERSAALKKRQKAGSSKEAASQEAAGLQRIRALAQIEDLSDEDFGRSMVQSLLVQEFGEAMVNDPRFQRIVTRIADMLSSDEEARSLVAAARRDLAG